LDNIFSLTGKVITKDNTPCSGCRVLAYDKDFLLDIDDLLGESLTDEKGFFKIEFDKNKFTNLIDPLEGNRPDVYLFVNGKDEKDIITTRITKTKREIDYHIKVIKSIPDPTAPNIYAGNTRRIISMLQEVGGIIDLEHKINLSTLKYNEISNDTRNKLENFVNKHNERKSNFEHFLVIFNSLINTQLEELKKGQIGYDGAQVPKSPHRTPYDQVIIWPREENFKWE
jgi:hypothetical protein